MENEEAKVGELLAAKPALEDAQQQMLLLKDERREFKTNQEDYDHVVDELRDKKIAEFLSKEGFQGTLREKSESIQKRREAVDKKMSEAEIR